MLESPAAERGATSLLYRETFAHPAAFSAVAPLRLRHAPLLLLAVCFSAGELCRHWWQPPAHVVICCVLLLAAALLSVLRARRMAFVATAIFWVSLGWAAASLQPPRVDTSLLRYADQLQRNATGRITAVRRLPPRATPTEALVASRELRGDEESVFAAHPGNREATYSLDVAVESIEEVTADRSSMLPVHGSAQVTLLNQDGFTADAVPCGARVTMTLRLHPPQRFLDPGVFQYADQLATRGISVQSSADAATVHVLDRSHPSWRCRFATAQAWSVLRLQRLASLPAMRRMPPAIRLDAGDTGMLAAMLFGDRSGLDADLRTAFERTGSFHLFVVAGLHIAVLLGLLYAPLLRLQVPALPAAALALSVTAGYALLTGFGAPAQRALLMSGVYLLTTLLGRERNAMNALGAAVLAMLIVRPAELFESGFQLTVLAIFAVAGIALPLAERTVMPFTRALREIDAVRRDPYYPPRLAQLRVSLRWMGEALAAIAGDANGHALLRSLPALCARCLLWLAGWTVVTLCAEAVMALPMAIYFHRATPFAAPANLLALPLVGPLMVSAGVTFLATLVHPLAAVVPGSATALPLHGVTHVMQVLASLRSADIRTPGPAPVFALVSLLLWCVAFALLRAQARRMGVAACVCVLAGLSVTLWHRQPALHAGRLEFAALDVGQGDSLLVVSPRSHVMLIDAGGPTGSADVAVAGSFDMGEQVISPYLWSRGIRQIDVLALTHAHSDHVGGMAAVLRNFSPRELWISVDANTPPFRALMALARERGTVVRHLRAGDQQAWDGTEIRVLHPGIGYLPRHIPTNDDSLVLHLRYGRGSVLAAGDAEGAWEGEQALALPLPVTLLKVGHHGSNTSTSDALLANLHPAAAVISCGRGNHFGHPRMQVLQRLQAAGIRTARTDNMGAIQYLLDADGSMEMHTLASP